MKQNTVEEFEFECSRCGKKVNLKSSIPVVKATTHPRSAERNFVAFVAFVPFIPCQWVIFQRLPQNSGDSRSGPRRFNFTQWIHIVQRIAPFLPSVQEARTEAVRRREKIQFDGFYLTHGHYSCGATFHELP